MVRWRRHLACLLLASLGAAASMSFPSSAANSGFMVRTEHPIRDPAGDVAALRAESAFVLGLSEDEVKSGFSTAGPQAGLNARYLDAVETIATLYHLTGQPEYARRAAVLLYEFSKVSPEWPVTSRIGLPDEPLEPDWVKIGHEMGRVWSTWNFYDLCSVVKLSRAYDLVYRSGELERLGRETGVDMIQHLESYFEYWWKVYTIHWPPHWGNVDGHRIECMFNYAESLGRPEWVRQAIRWLDALLSRGYLRDGMWHEGSPSYHNQVSATLRPILGRIDGYSDSEGYVDPVENDRIEYLDAQARWGYLVDRIHKAVADLRLPNGKYVSIEDAHSRDGAAPLNRSEPRLFPGLGYAILGTGSGEGQFQAHLNFTSPMGHEHLDGLNIVLYAYGEEILSEGEYLGDRAWNSSTIAHNTVVVDQRNQHGRSTGVRRTTNWGNRSVPVDEWPSIHGGVGNFANILAYDALSPVMMVEAEASNLYGPPVTAYRRLIAVVPRPDGAPYVLDVFRVAGGRYHDWMIHGPLHAEYMLESNLELRSRPGRLYGHIESLRNARTETPILLDIRAESGVGNRVYLLEGKQPSDVTIGMGPGVRRAGRAPYGAVRRGGPESVFVAVHEPYRANGGAGGEAGRDARDAAPSGASDAGALEVRALLVPQGATDPVALEVRGNGYRDVLISTTDGPGEYDTVEVAGVRAAGRLVWIRFDESGEVAGARVFGGGFVETGSFRLESDGDWSGAVTGAGRFAGGPAAGHAAVGRPVVDDAIMDGAIEGYFDVSGLLPEGDALAGRLLVLTAGDGTRHGYRIASVAHVEGQSRVFVIDDPGVEITGAGMKQLFFPNWNIPGTVTYEILGRAGI